MVTELPPIDRSKERIRGGAAVAALLPLFWFALTVSFIPGQVRAEERDTVLEASGIHYPGGYDPHTVGEVRGRVSRLTRPEKGPVRFLLVTSRETYTVLASPSWYWNDSRIKDFEGLEITVRGSKSLGKDGNLYIIAQEISAPSLGKPIELRAQDGTPLWKGSGGRWGWGSAGGGGPASGGRGGFGGGFGGGGRGRR